MAMSGINLQREKNVIYNHRRGKNNNMIDYARKMTILLSNGERKEEECLWERTNYTLVGPVSNLEKMNGKRIYVDGKFTQAIGTKKVRDGETTKYGQILMICTKLEKKDKKTDRRRQIVTY